MLQVNTCNPSVDSRRSIMPIIDVRAGRELWPSSGRMGPAASLFNLITGVLKPDSGRVLFKGEDITGLSPNEVCGKRISRSFQVVNVFQPAYHFSEYPDIHSLTAAANMESFSTPASTLFAVEETNGLLKNVGLFDKKGRIGGALSHGDRKVLDIAMALGGNPELLILDEPTAGMSPEETTRCIDLILELREKFGLTILFCEHDMEIVFRIASRIMVMVRGATVIQDTCNEVRRNQAVQDAYLGGSDVCLMKTEYIPTMD